MKNIFVCAGLIFALCLSIPASAANHKDDTKKSELEKYQKRRKKMKNLGPCRVIKNACIQAGFKEDGPRGKDSKKDCEEMLLLGSSVQGVHLIPGIIASCKANKESNPENAR